MPSADCASDSWQFEYQRNPSGSAINSLVKEHKAQAQTSPPSPTQHKENEPPAQQHSVIRKAMRTAPSESSSATAPETPQQHTLVSTPSSSFKERVALKMAELERSIQKVVPGHGRLASRAKSSAPFVAVGGRHEPEADPMSATEASIVSQQSRSSRSARAECNDAVQRLAYPVEGDTARIDAAGYSLHRPGSREQHRSCDSLEERHAARNVARLKDELSSAERKLAGAQQDVERLQLAVAREHEARLRAERRASETAAAALPASAAAEMNIKEVAELRSRLAASEETAESRRRALLAEKAKAQNALGQLAIAREKVKLAQGRQRQQQEEADGLSAQLQERTAQCQSLAMELEDSRQSAFACSDTGLQEDLEVVQRQLQASHGANADLRCQVDVLQQQLAQAQRRATLASASMQGNTVPHHSTLQSGRSTPRSSEPMVSTADFEAAVSAASAASDEALAATKTQLQAVQAEVGRVRQQETRQRQRAEEMERAVNQLRKDLRSAEDELAEVSTSAKQAHAAAAAAERTLLNQALEMDDLQQAAVAAEQLLSDMAELRAAEAAAQLRVAEALQDREDLRAELVAAQASLQETSNDLVSVQRELKQAQSARMQQQRAFERQEARVDQLKSTLSKRDAELAAQRKSAQEMQEQRTAAESWLDY